LHSVLLDRAAHSIAYLLSFIVVVVVVRYNPIDKEVNPDWLGAGGQGEFEIFMSKAETFVAALPAGVLATQLQVCTQDVNKIQETTGWDPTTNPPTPGGAPNPAGKVNLAAIPYTQYMSKWNTMQV